MIQLHRPPIPAPLAAAAPAATKALWAAWKKDEKLEIKASIYAHAAVKTTLREAQRDKCAYCETLNPTSHDVVEHFRPKNGWRQRRGDPLRYPEYFWLAYDWENLLFACDRCNDAGHKQNLFPLRNPSRRATAASYDIKREQPLLLNPYDNKDPEKHIEWSRDVPRPRRGSRIGRTTIETFGLAQDSLLLRKRERYLNDTEKFLAAIEELPMGHPKRDAVRPVFQERLSPTGEWSAMVRANLGPRILAL